MWAQKGMNKQEEQKTFFIKLKETVRTIDNDVLEIRREMDIPRCDLPEYSALMKLEEVGKNLDVIKEKANDLENHLKKKNEVSRTFYGDMEDLVSEMEEKLAHIEEYITQYGYKPQESEDIPQNNCLQENGNEFLTPAEKVKTTCMKVQDLLEATPMMIDYDMIINKESNVKTNLQINSNASVQKKRVAFQTNDVQIPRQMNQRNFITPVRQPVKEEKKLTKKLEDILERTPMIVGYCSASNRELELRESAEEFPLMKPLNLNISPEKKDSTPDVPLPYTTQRNKQKSVTPECPVDSVTKTIESTPEAPVNTDDSNKIKDLDKTPELNITSYRTFLNDRRK